MKKQTDGGFNHRAQSRWKKPSQFSSCPPHNGGPRWQEGCSSQPTLVAAVNARVRVYRPMSDEQTTRALPLTLTRHLQQRTRASAASSDRARAFLSPSQLGANSTHLTFHAHISLAKAQWLHLSRRRLGRGPGLVRLPAVREQARSFPHHGPGYHGPHGLDVRNQSPLRQTYKLYWYPVSSQFLDSLILLRRRLRPRSERRLVSPVPICGSSPSLPSLRF